MIRRLLTRKLLMLKKEIKTESEKPVGSEEKIAIKGT